MSIAVHVVIAVVLLVRLPIDVPEPSKEEVVQVEIVPPPEPEKPPEEQPKPPEPPKQEEAKQDEPPPPPPPAAPKAKPETKPAEPPPPEQEKAADQKSPDDEPGKGQSIPLLRPVFEFGEKDGGPRKSDTGNASTEAAVPNPETVEPATEMAKPAEAAPAEEPATEQPSANPVPEGIDVPEVNIAGMASSLNGPPGTIAPSEVKTEIVPAQSSTPAKPADAPKVQKPAELKDVKTLFSQNETGDASATTAMGDVPRGVRAGQLCATELREQLRRGSPVYRPELLPAYRLPSGTVLEVQSGAFRADAQWYDLSFRCELNQNATKIVSFAFNVRGTVPRGDWKKRGFPEF